MEKADLKPDRKSGHKSDYDVLVVLRSGDHTMTCMVSAVRSKTACRLMQG